ncbi:hypothetical protein EDB92DRAFT_1815570 [Lactarius akahatsu]|uniref:Uncharacterized protein n=1 Tax=Lactarius akahatsu TaxID=416441 RepID=A0AAD4QET6_9AGAM|nr:hypothetical protein EDB92DRAFT_1815570 [Lactarius akahatsu]
MEVEAFCNLMNANARGKAAKTPMREKVNLISNKPRPVSTQLGEKAKKKKERKAILWGVRRNEDVEGSCEFKGEKEGEKRRYRSSPPREDGDTPRSASSSDIEEPTGSTAKANSIVRARSSRVGTTPGATWHPPEEGAHTQPLPLLTVTPTASTENPSDGPGALVRYRASWLNETNEARKVCGETICGAARVARVGVTEGRSTAGAEQRRGWDGKVLLACLGTDLGAGKGGKEKCIGGARCCTQKAPAVRIIVACTPSAGIMGTGQSQRVFAAVRHTNGSRGGSRKNAAESEIDAVRNQYHYAPTLIHIR